MALENVSELSRVLAERQRLGLVFARHGWDATAATHEAAYARILDVARR